MKRFPLTLLIMLLLAPLAALHAADAPKSASKPNIILVLSDDVGLSRIGCYGGAPFKTPHLDRLAAAGLRFERCYSMPLCGPSRAALLTGKYPFRTGATSNGNSEINPAVHPTISLVLQRAGYATCAIGKLGQSAPAEDAAAPKRLGFDESMLWMGRATPDRYWNPRYYRNGAVVQGKPDEFGPDLTHAFLVDFMKRHRERPFFVYYSAVLSHGPFVRTPDSKDDKSLVLDMVTYLDKQMGQLAAALDELRLRENTIILFTSDNGPYGNPLGTFRGRPMIGSKTELTEGGVREPLIVNCPGRVPSGKVCNDLTDFTDFFPTVLELTGVKAPEGLKFDGQSIAPQILGEPGRPRSWVYAQVGKEYFIADQRYKLYGDGKFVDISDSPLAETPATDPDAKRRLQAALDQLRAGQSLQSVKPERLMLRAAAAPDLKADVQVLVENKIICDAAYWLANAVNGSQVDSPRVAELVIAAAKKFKPATNLDEAMDVLKQEGILSSVAYWKQHAVAGERCNGANVARLVNKIAQRLKAK
ncbi:MAG: sulfatase-like hydrolase/transferase [Verrucomicrobia bacterium]|nr:sulfatase-like hydrolase/transferase [Verrucomicrobiota bacterium]